MSTNMNQHLSNRNQHLSTVNQDLSNLNQHLSNVNQHLSNLNQHISNVNQHISNVNQHISTMNQNLRQRNNGSTDEVVLSPGAPGGDRGDAENPSSSSDITGQHFSFMRTPATTSSTASAPLRASVSKTLIRSVYLARVVGGRLRPSRVVMLRFLECEATLQGIIGKVQDAIGSHDPIVLTDAQGNAILESEETTGSQHWKQNEKQILAVHEREFQQLQGQKRRRTSIKEDDAVGIGEVTEKLQELILASQSLTNLAATQRVILTPSQLQSIKQGFCCVVCMKFIEEPVFTQCCQSIIGCKPCVEQWQETSVHCAKCRVSTADNNILEVHGLSEAFSVLRSLFDEE
ncbi:nucleotide triphosphate diphosphatase NUDT15 isoform X2 [Scophthalmus maximus]|uniref:nucleotide triphosphate diphosphatase NUDT15 isoform X2 n=1 Tax=Scophthalmus maximus TaxID=52904 RepID=UPI001FA92991|nr:nucleotide triphosphate diphosphatase NUDT15 isoform X2 [Scophthalmus maximus]